MCPKLRVCGTGEFLVIGEPGAWFRANGEAGGAGFLARGELGAEGFRENGEPGWEEFHARGELGWGEFLKKYLSNRSKYCN